LLHAGLARRTVMAIYRQSLLDLAQFSLVSASRVMSRSEMGVSLQGCPHDQKTTDKIRNPENRR
ncbi:MAG: hypothetical protein WA637_07865, partial [Terriglobales bacterium]